ncbi:MAG: hypothetical protein NW215_15965 [Hyphomicrobiales bacterium]|nr:hypothetical protein [Hyphomicrobiales bacterium]
MRLIVKSVGVVLLGAALAALAYDATRMLANGGLAVSSLRQVWATFAPETLTSAEAWVTGAAPYVWTAIVGPVILFPAWMVLGGLGSLLFLAGYKPTPPEIVADLDPRL